ncbi:MAG TPA: stage II sporulation protein P [Candidatus Gemmiger faecigallinarum]|nr:stage II sporulation protein P [Candidatus Gemmiger faecigallinarum]
MLLRVRLPAARLRTPRGGRGCAVLKGLYRLLGRLLAAALTVLFAAAGVLAAAQLPPGGWLNAAALLLTQPAALPLLAQQAEDGAPQPSVAAAAAQSTPAPSPAASAAPAEQASGTAGSAAPGTPAPVATAAPAPDRPEDAGDIEAQTFSQGSGDGYVTLAAGSIKNSTENADSVLADAAGAGLPFEIELDSDSPQVLILHTHATECYQPWDEPWYDPAFAARDQDVSVNMCAVGARMAQILNEAGINTLHDETLHDSPSYTESYDRSAATARAYLEQYPSIKVILDVHRDAIERDGARIKPLTQINGQDVAQVMVIAGCDNGSTVPLPRWKQNLAFAAAWETEMETLYPGLTRPVLCGYRFYNQDITTGSLLIEIGGHANTLAEAVRAGEYAARALASLFGGRL